MLVYFSAGIEEVEVMLCKGVVPAVGRSGHRDWWDEGLKHRLRVAKERREVKRVKIREQEED